MKHIFILAAFATLALSIPVMGADQKKKKKDAVEAPQFPKQPYLNKALKALAQAQHTFNNSGANSQEVIKHLQNAVNKLGPMKDKGPYPEDCRRYSEQAIKHMQSGETDKVGHDIEQAMKAGIRAGEVGSQKKD